MDAEVAALEAKIRDPGIERARCNAAEVYEPASGAWRR